MLLSSFKAAPAGPGPAPARANVDGALTDRPLVIGSQGNNLAAGAVPKMRLVPPQLYHGNCSKPPKEATTNCACECGSYPVRVQSSGSCGTLEVQSYGLNNLRMPMPESSRDALCSCRRPMT